MNIEKYNRWLNESSEKRNVYILIGPPAVGKSKWVEDHAPKDNIAISKDDIIKRDIFPKYKLANKEIFNPPPKDLEVGQEHPEKKKLGKVVSYKRFSRSKGKEVEERAFENAKLAGEELNAIYDSEIKNAISSGTKNIIVDAIHMTKSTRKSSIELFSPDQFKIIAVIFPHEGYKEQIAASAEARAEAYLQDPDFAEKFDRSVSAEDYEKMYAEYQPPSKSEGFDEIITYNRFKKTDKEKNSETPIEERLIIQTRKFLEESKLSKYWKRRMESRAKRAKREPKNNIDKQWATVQQEKSSRLNNKIHKIFEQEIEVTEEIKKEIDEFLNRVKNKREEYKKRLAEKTKLIPLNQKRPKTKLKPPPTNAEIGTKGVAKGYRIKSKKSKSSTIAPSESFGSVVEEVEDK